VPDARGSASGEEVAKSEVTKSPSRSPLAGLAIGEGDLLQISVYDVPDFNQHVRVDANGEVSLPMIGTVKVLGLASCPKPWPQDAFATSELPRLNLCLPVKFAAKLTVSGTPSGPAVSPIRSK
jgi:polysaccharide biosynthesis/export protein